MFLNKNRVQNIPVIFIIKLSISIYTRQMDDFSGINMPNIGINQVNMGNIGINQVNMGNIGINHVNMSNIGINHVNTANFGINQNGGSPKITPIFQGNFFRSCAGPVGFNQANHIGEQIANITLEINGIEKSIRDCCRVYIPDICPTSTSEMKLHRSKCYRPILSKDHIFYDLILDADYQIHNSIANNMPARIVETVRIFFVNEQCITIECTGNVTNTSTVFVTINGNSGTKHKKIIYHIVLLLKSIKLVSTKGNINKLLSYLEDIINNTMFFKVAISKIVNNLKAFVGAL